MKLRQGRLILLTSTIAAAWIVPLAWVFVASPGAPAEMPREATLGLAVRNSILVALATATAACVLGACLARLIEGIDRRWRPVAVAILSAPLLVPAYLFALAWAPILSPTGIVVQAASGSYELNLLAFLSTVWVQCCAWFPVALLIFHASARLWSTKYDEAARVGGLHGMNARTLRWRWHIWPAVAAFALIMLLALGEFAVADYFGVRTLGTEIFAIVSAYLEPAEALVACRPLFAFSAGWVLLLAVAANRMRRTLRVAVLPGDDAKSSATSFVALSILAGCILVVPVAALLLTLAGGSSSVVGLLGKALVLAAEDIYSGVLVASVAAVATIAAAMISAQASAAAARSSNGARIFSVMAFATPGTIWAIGASAAITALNFSASTWLLIAFVIGLSLRALAPATEILVAAIRNVPPVHVEAARVSGMSGAATWWRIVLPQIGTPLALSFCLAWIWSLNEVTLTVLLAPAGFSTLMLRIFQTVHYGPPELLAALTLLHLLVIALLVGTALLIVRGFHKVPR